MQIETISPRRAVDNAFLQELNTETDTSEMDEEIDRFVYEIYELSKEEIGIVEGSV